MELTLQALVLYWTITLDFKKKSALLALFNHVIIFNLFFIIIGKIGTIIPRKTYNINEN